MRIPGRSSAAALMVALVVLVAGCGVGPETIPRPLPVGDADGAALPAGDSDRAGVLVELWFVEEDQLVAVNRTYDTLLGDEEKIDQLEAGPTASEAAQGMRTTLTPVLPDQPLVVTAAADGVPVEVGPLQTAVVLNPEFTQLPSAEQLLVLGQTVLTLADRPGESVIFVDEQGSPVAVPLPGGRLTSEPVTQTDYAPLVRG